LKDVQHREKVGSNEGRDEEGKGSFLPPLNWIGSQFHKVLDSVSGRIQTRCFTPHPLPRFGVLPLLLSISLLQNSARPPTSFTLYQWWI